VCTFVTLIARCDDIDRLNAILEREDGRRHRRRAEIADTLCIRPHLSSGEREFCLVRSSCDCGTWLGSAVRFGPTPEERLKADGERYRRKGWTEAKITRALASRKQSVLRPPRHIPNEDADYWIDLLSKVAAGLSVPALGLMHHFYRKSMDEAFDVSRLVAGQIETSADILASMQDGVIHDFDCRSGGT